MKKILLILLICIYSLSSFGISFKEFYCCGKLKSIYVSVLPDQKNNCKKDRTDEGCCKTKYQYFKVSDKHLTVTAVDIPSKFSFEAVQFITSFPLISAPLSYKVLTNGSHAPPFIQAISMYKLNCVFRI
jgi:hypothetical protein